LHSTPSQAKLSGATSSLGKRNQQSLRRKTRRVEIKYGPGKNYP
jgi:hypothetical protein